MRKLVCLCLSLLIVGVMHAQSISDSVMQYPWQAKWITTHIQGVNQYNASATDQLHNYGVYKFRKDFELTAVPDSFIIHVSGDNRYKLFVNEKLVLLGPARGDLYFWNFETADISKYLNKGKNTIAALVWNEGFRKPEAQISYVTAFILQGNSSTEQTVNTDTSWRVMRDSSYAPLYPNVPFYYTAGAGELVNMNNNLKDWYKTNYNSAAWSSASTLNRGLTKDASRDARGWMLVPSTLPQMEMKQQRFAAVRKADGVTVNKSFPSSAANITVPAHSTITLTLDQGMLTNGYPTLIFSKGKNAGISLTYAEGLFKRDIIINNGDTNISLSKGNRNDIAGKVFIGKKDSIISDGSNDQQFTTLWWRTFRYIQLLVHTEEEPLIINDVYSTFTGYPFVNKASFNVDDSADKKILDIGWRTARLCAFETYIDCPYYEQLQYIGDARIQALVTLYNTSDDRLVRNALTLMDHSRVPEGITQSRYPTDLDQQIPTFSLWWIAMLHDYRMYRNDTAFIKNRLPGTRDVLSFFGRYQQADGSLKNVPYWLFTDWSDGPGWDGGVAPIGKAGFSSVLDIQLAWVYSQAAELETQLGFKGVADFYNAKSFQLKQTIKQRYWDNNKQMFADTEEKNTFSQHANSLAILAGIISGDSATLLAKKLMSDTTLAQASIYFKYYLHQAYIKAGLGNDYTKWLSIWKENIDSGLTTWAEWSDVNSARSDCHAWGSSPNIEFYRTILGIDSDAPGFSKIKIEPHIGSIKKISGSIPHPSGNIAVSYEEKGSKWNVHVSIPNNVTGSFIWKGKSYDLKGGTTDLSL